jgi:hypothetical protein
MKTALRLRGKVFSEQFTVERDIRQAGELFSAN